MTSNVKFSIVIAAYNNTKTINRCLDSIYRQSYTNYEVILSDDCSPDVDYTYLKEKYENLKILRLPKNSGAGPARQYGIDNGATGDWLLFVDQDDELYNRHALLYIYKLVRRYPNSSIIRGNYTYVDNIENSQSTMDHGDSDIRPLHATAFNVSFMRKYNIRFHDSLRYNEDVYFNILFRLMTKYKHDKKEKGLICCNDIIYRQHKTNDSITQKKYNGQNYFEGIYYDQVNLYIFLFDNLVDIIDETDKIHILLTPIFFAMVIYRDIYVNIDNIGKEIIDEYTKNLTKIIDKFKNEFHLESTSDIRDIIYKIYNKSSNQSIQIQSPVVYNKTEDFLKVFDKIESLYTEYKGVSYND